MNKFAIILLFWSIIYLLLTVMLSAILIAPFESTVKLYAFRVALSVITVIIPLFTIFHLFSEAKE